MKVIGWLVLFLLGLIIWTVSILICLLLFTFFSSAGLVALIILSVLFLILFIPLNITPLRRSLISKPVLNFYRKVAPHMSRTEKEGLEAGNVWWDAELFSGKPNWKKLLSIPAPKLSAEEQAFLDGPVEELCRMTDDWDITHNRADLPPEVWKFIKEQGFFSIIIPKRYGGKEFSALAHSAIMTKLSSRSVTLATTVGVPNSLGPAELLLHYGTEEQKNYYLPRLAKGEEIPCFALTAPKAGSDAAAMPDYGIVCRGQFQGKEVIGICINWSKRYITLGPIATVIGLAFKLYDPDHLLGDKEELGITCALIHADTPGVVTGRRHFPLNAAFLNGPVQGKDVFIPVDWIIGGKKMAGHGWKMLMESLAAGRAISLPSTVAGGAKIGVFASGAYSRIRRQFGLSIGRFEGIEEVLARMTSNAYILDATRIMTVAAVDRGERPSVLTAISKYHCTELGRKIANDTMDIHGGKGIQLGPRNYIGRAYQEMPIGITVEGANILTRSLIIFGQGAIRCHPFVYPEMQAAKDEDKKRGLINFDKALFGHIGFFIGNIARSFLLAITNGKLSKIPTSVNKRYYQQISRFSAAFALVADGAMLLLGGELKRREKLSARLGDVLSMLYLTSAVLKHYEDQGRNEEDLPIIHWSCNHLLFFAQHQLDSILKNFPNKLFALWLRTLVFPLGKRIHEPGDKLDNEIANLMINVSGSRYRLGAGTYLTPDKNNQVGQMEEALKKIIVTEEIQRRLKKAKKDGVIFGITFEDRVKAAVEAKVLTPEEAKQLLQADALRQEVYAVDDFAFEDLVRTPSYLFRHSSDQAK